MKLTESPKAEKKQHLDRLLQKGAVIALVDARQRGVMVPKNHLANPQLPLNLSYNFQIPDFKITEKQVQITLTFPEGKYFCVVPMEAIYGMISKFEGEMVLFPENVPLEFLAQYLPHKEKESEKPKRLQLSVVSPQKKEEKKPKTSTKKTGRKALTKIKPKLKLIT